LSALVSDPSPRISRQVSRRNIFETLLTQGPISRAALSKVTGLSKQTTSEVVEHFEEQGLVRAVGRTSGSIGRTAVLYELSPDAGYCLGVDLGGSKLSAAVAGFSGRILVETTEPTDKRGGANVVDQIFKLATKLIRQVGSHPARIRSAVVGTPGVMNASTGNISLAPNIPHFSELNVVGSLSERLGLNVLVENDVNLGLLGEIWHGCAQRLSDVVFIALGTGIGLGLCANGKLVRGFNGAAGEIGYFPIGGDPLRAVVRDQGCLEYEVGAAGILRRYEAAGGKNASEVLTIFERMGGGDKPALKVIEETAHLLARTVAIAAVFSDPKLIVLGGSIGSRPELVARIAEDTARLIPRPVEICASALGNRASMIGAVSVAVTHLHEELFGVTDLSGPLSLPAPEQASLGEAS
jgi:predicted NBD/HSP70 family sugar kinase